MSAHANPAICPNSSSSTPVPSHPYGTRTKQKALAQNLKMLSHDSHLMLHQQFSRKFQKNNFQSFSQ
ncbi:dipeptidase 3 [Corchorus olitorius]|uniref:Dipeptidase 3 n=1 Tax=Corchorus olitorius TaxID=93759 RepID=A0A1R3G395_9ROSI|nr:dipeptidase 3 [Corchorus olitorius]